MSARDSESGSSSYRGGSGNAGGLGNGGVGGGSGGGHRGGGAGYNGGIGSRTGLTSGKDWRGNSAFGRAGGPVQAYGMRDARSLGRAGMGPTVGTYSNFRTPNGAAMFGNSPAQGRGMGFHGMNMGQALSQARRADAAWQGASAPEGLLGTTPTPAAAPSYPAVEQEMALPPYEDVPPEVVPAPEEWTPASPYNPPLKSIPRFTNMQRSQIGRNFNNDSSRYPRQGVPGVRSTTTIDAGGYPSVGQDTRPAGLY